MFRGGLAYIIAMAHRKHAAVRVDEVLTDVFVGLVIVALIAGVVAQIHT